MSATLLPEQQRAIDYLAKKGTGATADRLREQLRDAFAAAERAFDDVPAELRESAPAPGKWCAHEIMDHLVLSHGPAIPQFESLLKGMSPDGVAIPADLHRDDRPEWNECRNQLGEIHRELERLMDTASDDLSLDAKAVTEIVVKVDGKPLYWYERLDWKAFIQGVRVHTIEHQNQLARTLAGLEARRP
jgi:hypothetical protein